MKIYAYTITRADSPDRCKLLLETLTKGRETAGVQFHWHVHVNGSKILGKNMVDSCFVSKIIDSYEISEYNEGQHPPTNKAIALAIAKEYDYIVRIDDDVEWISKRWLAKLVEASIKLGNDKVVSPMVRGLRWQPAQSLQREVENIPVRFVDGPIGGICRLIPIPVLKHKPYVSDVRLPMGGGDAGGVGNWATKETPFVHIVYCQHIKVRHAKTTDIQEIDDPKHFQTHPVYQHVPYIPIWKPDVTTNSN